MQEIEKLRAELDQIQADLVGLFRRRLTIAQKIWQIKKATQLPFTDVQREETIVHRFDESIVEAEEKIAVQNFSKNIISETKKYLEVKLK